MKAEPELSPVIVGSVDGARAILLQDGSSASFVDGKWQPGIAFDHRDFLDMPVIGNENLRTRILAEASHALAKSLEPYPHERE